MNQNLSMISSGLDFILIFGISIGLFISTSLLFVKKQNNKANKILAYVLILAVIMLLGRLFFLKYYKDILRFRVGTILDGTVFIFGPLVLLFFKTLLFKDDKNKKLTFWYFIPAFIYGCFALYTFSLDNKTYYTKVTTGQFHKFYFLIELFGVLTNSFFVYKSYLLIKKYKQVAVKQISFNQNIIRFSNYFISVYAFIILSWIISFINFYFLKSYSKFINYNIVWISIPVLIYLIGFYVLTQPEVFKVKPKSTTKKNTTNRLSEEKITQLKADIEALLKKEKLYHKSDLSLPDLAKELNISNNDLSWFINTICKTNFYEFINTYRIEEFIERIKNGDFQKHTITAISIDVGFNSKSTFYKAFKLITNTTPVAYIKKLNLNT